MSALDIPSPPAHVGPESNGMMMTPDEYDALEDWNEDNRYELVQGVLIVSPLADIGERSPNDYLSYMIFNYPGFPR